MGIWGSYDNIPKAIFYLLKEDYKLQSPSSHTSRPYMSCSLNSLKEVISGIL